MDTVIEQMKPIVDDSVKSWARSEALALSSKFNEFWMPVEDAVFSGDQGRHDDSRTFTDRYC